MDDDTRDELLRLLSRFDQAEGLVYAICEAMDQDVWSAKTFAPALYGAHEYLTGLIQDLRRSVDAAQRPIGGIS